MTRALAVAALLLGCAAKNPAPATPPPPATPEAGVPLATPPPPARPEPAAAPIDLPKSSPAADRPRLYVTAALEGTAHARIWIDGTGSGTVVNLDSPKEQFTRIAREARAKLPPGPDTQVVLAIDRRVQHGVVVSLIDAFKSEGIHNFAFSVAPASAGGPSP